MANSNGPRSILSRLLLIVGVLGVVLAFGISQDNCNDVWGHALHGKVMVEKKRFPHFSDYSFVTGHDVAKKSEWVQAISFYFLLEYLGYGGLLLFKTVVLALTASFILLWLSEEGVPPSWGSCGFAWFTIIAYSRFMPRGDMLNMTFLVLYLYLIARYRRRRDRSLWLLPLAQLLWSQVHYLAGLGVFTILVHSMEGLVRQSVDRRYRANLLKIAGICLVANFATPLGYEQGLEPFRVLWQIDHGQQELYRSVFEFFPIFFYTDKLEIAPLQLVLRFAIPLALLLLTLWPARKWVRLSHLLLLAATALVTLRFRRFMGIYGVVVAPLIALYLWQWSKAKWARAIPYLQAAAIGFNILLAALVVSNRFYLWQGYSFRCEPTISTLSKPVRAVEFIRAQNLHGNLCTDYNTGGFVGYHLYPKSKIFAHSLSLWYSNEHFLLVKNMLNGDIDPDLLDKNFGIDGFLVMHTEPRGLDNVRRLHTSPNWKLVYVDATSAFYANRRLLPPQRLLQLVEGARTISPDDRRGERPYFLARFFMAIGDYELARELFEKSIAQGMFPSASYYTLGTIARIGGDLEKALEYFVASAQIDRNELALVQIEELLPGIPLEKRDSPLYRQALELYCRGKNR